MTVAVYVFVVLSGAAALIYQVVWVRSLTLVFGGSHHAVTVVLAVFMAGLALGGWWVGRIADRVERPLRLYGGLEIGIAAGALAFAGLMQVYPAVYAAVARGRDDAPTFLFAVRALFAGIALIVPATLMGGTLPVLTRVLSGGPNTLRRSLPFLYGLNTLGAVAGALLAGFVLLPVTSVTATMAVAIVANAVVGAVSLVLQRRIGVAAPGARDSVPVVEVGEAVSPDAPRRVAYRFVLWGIAISGFCALGYEVLWTRVLTISLGASVYSFTVMLVAFLVGIALGSQAYGVPALRSGQRAHRPRRVIATFGIVQVAIGLTALLATLWLGDVPVTAARLDALLMPSGTGSFGVRVTSGFVVAFLYMVVPAFLMGLAFPLAGEVHARDPRTIGRAVGEVLAWNTVGAILGTLVSGFVLIRLVGIERSLELLIVLNVGTGLLVLAGLARTWRPGLAVAVAAGVAFVWLATNPDTMRLWDAKYLAIYRSNQPDAFRTPAMVREALANTDILYYAEGVEAIVSVIRVKGGEQAFVTNGRVEASSHLQARQNQLTLGHLPMLLAPRPRNVLVVGLGSGMTLGATSVHPGVERITVAEIEPKVVGVARTFAAYNHAVVDDPRVRIVFNDGRNFLMTTRETFDVITADPIHPWFRGAGNLYTTEYFRLAATHLRPGGVIAQWLPIYELSPSDLRSIVRTFREQFPHTLLWLTHYDATLVGSRTPFVLDETELGRRLEAPVVAADLQQVAMGSPADLLSYFVMGTDGMTRFGAPGVVNRDDRPHLEFSAPFSIASPSVMEANVRALGTHRESLLPYLVPAADPQRQDEQRRRWAQQRQAGLVGDEALALFLGGRTGHPHFAAALAALAERHPAYAPGRFLRREHEAVAGLAPRPLDVAALTLANDRGGTLQVEIHAVLVPVSRQRAAVMFVDNRAKTVYGQRYVDDYERGDTVSTLVSDVMTTIRTVYQKAAETSLTRGQAPPPAVETLGQIRSAIGSKVGSAP